MSKAAGDQVRDEYPCMDFLDFTVGYRVLDINKDGIRTSTPLTRAQAADLGLTDKELFSQARHNTRELFNTRLYKLVDLVKRICEGEEAPDLMESEQLDPAEIYVATNDSGMFGAAVILQNEVLDSIAQRLGGSIYILPSSVHELIIVPTVEYDPQLLKETVREVNSTVVNENDFLSDSVYVYSAGGNLTIFES